MRSNWGRRFASYSESILSSQGIVYTFILIYSVINVLLFLNAVVQESKMHDDFQKYTTGIARGCGATINFNMGFVILLASRSALGLLRQTPLNLVLPIEKAMPDLHRLVGTFIVLAGILHSVLHWITYIVKSPWTPGFTGFTSLFITGMLLFVFMVLIRMAATYEVYHASYEAFLRLHTIGSTFAFALLIIHGLHRGIPSSWKWVIGPLVMYVLDLMIRSFKTSRSYLLVAKHSAVFQGRSIVKIRLPRVFHFEAGQYAELKVPRLSRLQWHPFTIASAPHEPEMVFYIKSVGDWTMGLYDLFKSRIHGNQPEDIEVHIRGPFGAPAQHVGQFDRVLLIGGGVGATPFCSVVKDAYYWFENWTPRKRSRSTVFVKDTSASAREASRNENTRDNKTSVEGVVNTSDGLSGKHGSLTTVAKTEDSVEEKETRQDSRMYSSNVFSERLESIGALDDIRRLDRAAEKSARNWSRSKGNATDYSGQTPNVSSMNVESSGNTSMYTARDYLISMTEPNANLCNQFADGEHSDSVTAIDIEPVNVDSEPIQAIVTEDDVTDEITPVRRLESRKVRGILSTTFGRSSREHAGGDGMGTYHENSTGTYHRSLDYMSAIHAAYSLQDQDETFQRSLDLMLGISFGSVTLVRSMQIRQAQRNMRSLTNINDGEQLPLTIDKEDLSLFQKPQIMFLLLMRSVTINIIVLWLLLIRFVVAIVAHIFGGLRVFQNGVALYEKPSLICVDLALSVAIAILVGIPSIIEMLELGAAPVHGFDLFVLTPAALFAVVVDIIALAGIGGNVRLFNVFHVLVLWPLLSVVLLYRLLRVIGERIAQAAHLTTTHLRTRQVDFFWTAPTAEDDEWLVKELRDYTGSSRVRMHQVLTRTEAPTVSSKHNPSGDGIARYYGRPRWADLLNGIAERCENNTTIGVFFCGPPSMGVAIQNACMSAMRNSIVRGLHAGAKAMRGLEEVFGEAVSANEYTGDLTKRERAGARGCNVKVVFKRETFS